MTLPTLRYRSRGHHVHRLQSALIAQARSDQNDCLGQPFPRGKDFETDGDFGTITKQAVTSFQTTQSRENPDFAVDGECGPQTWAALGFQDTTRSSSNTGAAAANPARQTGAQGRIAGQGRNAGRMTGRIDPPAGTPMPAWMTVAWREHNLDIRESFGGNSNNARILEYLRQAPGVRSRMFDDGGRNATRILARAETVDARRARDGRTSRNYADSFAGKRMSDIDETPWCGCFVQWCMTTAGYPRRPGFAGARSWKPNAGETSPSRYGAICVVEHTKGGFHVGFLLETLANGVKLLGGNQSNRVCVQDFTKESNIWYNWPPDPPT